LSISELLIAAGVRTKAEQFWLAIWEFDRDKPAVVVLVTSTWVELDLQDIEVETIARELRIVQILVTGTKGELLRGLRDG
jgi:hypothetical protein